MQVVYTYRVIAGPDEHDGFVCGGFALVLGLIFVLAKPYAFGCSSGTGEAGTFHKTPVEDMKIYELSRQPSIRSRSSYTVDCC